MNDLYDTHARCVYELLRGGALSAVKYVIYASVYVSYTQAYTHVYEMTLGICAALL